MPIKGTVLALVAVIIAAAVVPSVSGSARIAHAQQQATPSPANLAAANGANPGEVVLRWTPAAGYTERLVGCLAVEDHEAYPDSWQEKFAFSDVVAGSTWTASRLTPGIDYYFIVGRKHAGGVAASQWIRLTLSDGCVPAPTGESVTVQSWDDQSRQIPSYRRKPVSRKTSPGLRLPIRGRSGFLLFAETTTATRDNSVTLNSFASPCPPG